MRPVVGEQTGGVVSSRAGKLSEKKGIGAHCRLVEAGSGKGGELWAGSVSSSFLCTGSATCVGAASCKLYHDVDTIVDCVAARRMRGWMSGNYWEGIYCLPEKCMRIEALVKD